MPELGSWPTEAIGRVRERLLLPLTSPSVYDFFFPFDCAVPLTGLGGVSIVTLVVVLHNYYN